MCNKFHSNARNDTFVRSTDSLQENLSEHFSDIFVRCSQFCVELKFPLLISVSNSSWLQITGLSAIMSNGTSKRRNTWSWYCAHREAGYSSRHQAAVLQRLAYQLFLVHQFSHSSHEVGSECHSLADQASTI